MKPTIILLPILFGSLLSHQATAVPKTGSATQFTKSNTLHFIENKGQIIDQHHNPRTDIDFKIPAGNGLNIFIGAGKLHYQWTKHTATSSAQPALSKADQTGATTSAEKQAEMYRMDVTLLNANTHAEIITEEKQPYYEQHYGTHTGPDGATAHTYRKITYREVYPNIDWVFRINDQGKLEHDFIVRPGGKVSDIRLQYAGADSLRYNSNGSITAVTPLGTVTESTPYCFQENGTPVAGKFILENNILGFATAAHQGTLIIDPVLEWATYFGGASTDQINNMSADSTGNIFITGFSSSIENIATTGSFQDTITALADAFVARFDNSGQRIWSTYYGETGNDIGHGIDCNMFGYVYMFGSTTSKNGITTPGCHQEVFGGSTRDAFLVQLDTSGKRIWATYLGGARNEYETGTVICDPHGYVYVCGATNSSDGISTAGAHQETKQGSTSSNDAFLVKFDNAGKRIWGTYFGGTAHDYGNAIVYGDHGNLFFAGRTASSAITGIAATAHQPALGAKHDAFLAMFDSSGQCRWGTYYGGAEEEYILSSVDYDGYGSVYLTGTTASTDNISTPGSYQSTYAGGGCDAFLAKFDTTGKCIWGTYYGGEAYDYGYAVHCDQELNIYLAGYTNSATGIASPGSIQATNNGMNDLYIAKMDSGGYLSWASYYGGAHEEHFSVNAVSDMRGNIYLAGNTESITGVATTGSHQTVIGGGLDGMLVKISDCDLNAPDTITGPLFVCPGELVEYKVAPVPGAASYTWTLPSSWTGSSTTDSIMVKAGDHSDTIRVSAHLFCGTTPDQLLVISVSPGATISTAGTSLCAGDSNLLYANTHPGISWQWLHNNTAVVGTDSILLAWQRGHYSLLTNLGHCTDTSDPVIIHPLPLPRITQDGNILSTESHFISYQWYYGTQSITGATQSSYTYTAEGDYSVKVTDTNGCTGISEPFTPVHVAFLGSVNSIRIYPNPANSVIHITAASPVSATITAMDGREILRTEKTDRIDITTLPDGLYLLQVKDSKGHTIHKEKMVKSSF